MDWFGADTPLIATRAVHFAATALTAGTLVFRLLVVKPVLHPDDPAVKRFQMQTLRIAWAGLAVTVISGVSWLLLQAASMSGLPFRQAISAEMLLTVLNQTQFGLVCEIRIVLAAILALCLAYDRLRGRIWGRSRRRLVWPPRWPGSVTLDRPWVPSDRCM